MSLVTVLRAPGSSTKPTYEVSRLRRPVAGRL